MPDLVQVQQKYSSQGVKFLALTPEEPQELEAVMGAVSGWGIQWPVGYGAMPLLKQLGVEGLPTVFVLDPKGQIVWRSDRGRGDLEQAIDRALSGESSAGG